MQRFWNYPELLGLKLEQLHVKQELDALLVQNNTVRLVQNIPAHQYRLWFIFKSHCTEIATVYSVRYGGNSKNVFDYLKRKMSETEKATLRALLSQLTCLQRNWPPPLTWTWTSDETCLKVGETFCLYRRCNKRTFGCHCKAALWIQGLNVEK